MATSHRDRNVAGMDRQKGKKWKKTPFRHSGVEHDSNLTEHAPHPMKRKMPHSDKSHFNQSFPVKKHKSMNFKERNTKHFSTEQYHRKATPATSKHKRFTGDSDENDAGEDFTRPDRFSYEPASGTSGEMEASAEDMPTDESDSGDNDDDSDDDDISDEGNPPDDADSLDKESDEYAAIKKELANIPLEDLMKVKEKIGLKVFNKIMHGHRVETEKRRPKVKKSFKRENKNRPREMSSKRPVSIVRHMDHVSKKHTHHRDPRFDDLSGQFKDEYFEKNYSFLDEIKEKEKQIVKKKLRKTTDGAKKKELQGLLMRMTQAEQVRDQKKKQAAIEKTWKSKEKEMVKDGKTPYFLKKSEKKKLELAEKYRELQKSGKLEKYLTKKRKKNAQKERKKLPQQMNAK